jgi:hypothetical protein
VVDRRGGIDRSGAVDGTFIASGLRSRLRRVAAWLGALIPVQWLIAGHWRCGTIASAPLLTWPQHLRNRASMSVDGAVKS